MRVLLSALVLCALVSLQLHAQAGADKTADKNADKNKDKQTKTDAAKTDAAKAEANKTDASKAEATKTDKTDTQQDTSGKPDTKVTYVYPTWFLFWIGAMILCQVIVLVMLSGVRADLDKVEDDVEAATTRLGELRHEIQAMPRNSPGQPAYAPQVSALTPAQGRADGGTRVRIRGRNFPMDTEVWFGGDRATIGEDSTATELIVFTPAGRLGVVDVYVVNPNGAQQPQPVRYRYIAFVLNPIPAPAAGQPLQLTGQGFTSETLVHFDGGAGVAATLVNQQTLRVALPAGNAGATVRVTLENPGGDRTEERQFNLP